MKAMAVDCKACDGQGVVWARYIASNHPGNEERNCGECRGTGERDACPRCRRLVAAGELAHIAEHGACEDCEAMACRECGCHAATSELDREDDNEDGITGGWWMMGAAELRREIIATERLAAAGDASMVEWAKHLRGLRERVARSHARGRCDVCEAARVERTEAAE